jgi:hypothetical protein
MIGPCGSRWSVTGVLRMRTDACSKYNVRIDEVPQYAKDLSPSSRERSTIRVEAERLTSFERTAHRAAFLSNFVEPLDAAPRAGSQRKSGCSHE